MTRFAFLSFVFVLAACSDPPRISTDAGSRDAGASIDAGLGHVVFFDEGLDATIVDRFANASTSPVPAPEIVYPESGTLVPPNMFGIDVHFRATVLSTFEVTFDQGGAPSVVVYIRCARVGDGCIFQPWREVWRTLAERRTAGPYTIRIRGLVGEAVTPFSAPVVLELADEPIEGGLYYFNTDGFPPSIRRHELGAERRSAETYFEPPGFSPSFVISRDGARLAIAVIPELGEPFTQLLDVATREPVGAGQIVDFNMLARFGPGHDLIFSSSLADVFDDNPLRLVSSEDGSVLHEWPSLGPAHSADWSPDGRRIVYLETVGLRGHQFLYDVLVIEKDEDGNWSEPRRIATPDQRPESPSFAPDSDWIAYSALDLAKQDMHGRFDNLLVALRISDGRIALLDRAHGSRDPADYEGASGVRWNPSPYTHDGRRVYWLTFSSTRPCGLLPREEDTDVVPQGHQIWMAAFDAESDEPDPSRPAFRVPAQVWGFNNEHAEWALSVRRSPCSTDDDCGPGEICDDGFCYGAPQ